MADTRRHPGAVVIPPVGVLGAVTGLLAAFWPDGRQRVSSFNAV
jgi:hypothetical protein